VSAIAIILARAGSKGVPGKNIAPVAGQPCIQWTLDHARQAGSLSEIIVSTDCPQAAAIARQNSATVIDRPESLAHDQATIDDAARHALAIVRERATAANAPEHIVILYANVPIRPAGLIDRAIELLRSSGCDSVQSYQPVGKHHPWWTARVDGGSGVVSPWEGDILNHNVFRRQDLPPAFIPDGAIIAVTARALMLEVPGVQPGPHAFFGKDRRGIINPPGSVIDIDTPIDLIVANAMLADASDGTVASREREVASRESRVASGNAEVRTEAKSRTPA
jgi:CMP-N,N'-diacetyllegionaminic acid synthase